MFEKTPRSLSTAWPRMTPVMRDRVQRHLADGCYCQAETATLTRRLINAHVVVHLQCDGCGRGISGGLSRNDHYFWQDYPVWNQKLVENYRSEWQERNEARLLDMGTQAEIDRETTSRDYAEWCRTSPDWHRLSRRVLQRSNFQCEACLASQATVAHHTTYRYGRLPPAWLLRAVCVDCHERLHADRQGFSDEWAGQRNAG